MRPTPSPSPESSRPSRVRYQPAPRARSSRRRLAQWVCLAWSMPYRYPSRQRGTRTPTISPDDAYSCRYRRKGTIRVSCTSFDRKRTHHTLRRGVVRNQEAVPVRSPLRGWTTHARPWREESSSVQAAMREVACGPRQARASTGRVADKATSYREFRVPCSTTTANEECLLPRTKSTRYVGSRERASALAGRALRAADVVHAVNG